jgi:uncharacterized protein YodC (DUF2158 family)
MEIKKGDTVRLKSGGPLMTVEDATYADAIRCTWFDDKSKRCREEFDIEILKPDTDSFGGL